MGCCLRDSGGVSLFGLLDGKRQAKHDRQEGDYHDQREPYTSDIRQQLVHHGLSSRRMNCESYYTNYVQNSQ